MIGLRPCLDHQEKFAQFWFSRFDDRSGSAAFTNTLETDKAQALLWKPATVALNTVLLQDGSYCRSVSHSGIAGLHFG